jgi:hypothetical protein
MDLNELKKKLLNKLSNHPLNPKYALSQFKLNNEDYRLSTEYSDPIHYPFYYYLGKLIQPKHLLEFGFESGIESGCFCHGCKSVEHFLGFKHKIDISYWSARIPKFNVGSVLKSNVNYWNGDITDPEFLKQFLVKKWDCALIVRSESHEINRRYFDLVWGQMPLGGLLVVDRIKSNKEMKTAFEEFCKIIQRPNVTIPTRYGVGIIEK